MAPDPYGAPTENQKHLKLMKHLEKISTWLKENHRQLMGSKWNNCEAEVIASQTVHACANNFKEHGEALSWLGRGCLRERAVCGTDNKSGLQRLLDDGSLVLEAYTGSLQPAEDTATFGGKPQVLRVTPNLLEYIAAHYNLKLEQA